MKLSVVLFTSKTLTDGTHPIMLRLFRKGKYYHKSLQISCKESDWNDKEKECRKSFNRHASFNKIIRDSKSKAQKRIDEMIANKKPFVIEDIFEPTDNTETKTLIQVIEEHKNQYTKFNTLQKYRKLIRKLKEFGHSKLAIEDVDATFIKAFYHKIKIGRRDTTIYTWMAVFEASLNTAVEKGYISENPFKYTNFKYDKTSQRRALSRYDIDKVIVYYRDKYLASIWSHEYSLSKIQTEYYALNIFLSSYYLQGLSLIDLAHLKVKDVVFSYKTPEGNKDYKKHHQKQADLDSMIDTIRDGISTEKQEQWVDGFVDYLEEKDIVGEVDKNKIITIETRRSKTNKYVKIVHLEDTVWFLLKPNMEGKEPDDYLFNIFNRKCPDNETYQFHRLTHITNSCNKQLKKVKEKLGLSIDTLTLYCARHTYASVLHHNGIAPGLIAQNLGRETRNIDVYLKQFEDEKIINSNELLKAIPES